MESLLRELPPAMNNTAAPPPLLLAAIVFAAVLLLAYATAVKTTKKTLPLPPGPRGLPFIGNMLLMDKLTHRTLADLSRRHAAGVGLLHLCLGRVHTVVASTPEMARQLLSVHDATFANRWETIANSYLSYNLSSLAFARYGPFWRRMRKLCVQKLFSRRRAPSRAAVRDEVDATVRSVLAQSVGAPIDVGKLAFELTLRIIFRAAFGSRMSEGDQEKLVPIMEEFSKLFGAFNAADFLPRWLRWVDPQGIGGRLRKARESLDLFVDGIIDEHLARRKGGGGDDDEDGDMVDSMLAYHDVDGTDAGSAAAGGELKLTRNNIKGIIMDNMFGGTETVATAVEWVMAELMRNPDERRLVQEELASVVGLGRKVEEPDIERLVYLRCAVKEALRLHPPIPLIRHASTSTDCDVAGYRVPSGSRVVINAWEIGRDPSSWKDPESFRPSRFAAGGEAEGVDFHGGGGGFALLTFGSGRRSCPGMPLGLYAAEMAVAQLMHCFEWELPEGVSPEELDMSDVFQLTAPRAARLAAVATPRLSSPLL